jgi:hypothetical protein
MLRSWLAVLLLLGVPLSGRADFGLCGWPVGVPISSYYPAPISYYAAPLLPPACVGPVVASPGIVRVQPPVYSQAIVVASPVFSVCPVPTVVVPRPAPPAQPSGPGSASDSGRSVFITARSAPPAFEVYSTALPDRAPAAARCPVSVWNLTDTTLVLTIDGQRATLGAGRTQTFEVNRDFEWQVEGRDRQKMTVPAAEKGSTIVIRR